jgi:uncharacterized protein YbbC (DUF1343 family)
MLHFAIMTLSRIRYVMFICTILLVISTYIAEANVLTGIDVLAGLNFDLLRGKRVGLITNQTGRSKDGRSTIDILFHAPEVHLTALFSPEHGIRGTEDKKIPSATDSSTGLPIYSLYGSTCHPTTDMLHNIDILVLDLQDIGTRFYTYIGTLSLAMEAAAMKGIPFVVLDRPNPISGEVVQGAIPATPPSGDDTSDRRTNGCRRLTSIHPVPTRHGMTIGELANMFNVEFGIGCELTVIPMQGWRRSMHMDETGLEWINPSPNMRSVEAALIYPGLGILESTNISVGRGTDRPFQLFGAPWVNIKELLSNLEKRRIPGIVISPSIFVPTGAGHPYKGQTCAGVSIVVSDRTKFKPVLAGLHLLQAFSENGAKRFRADKGFSAQVGDKNVWDLLTVQKMTPQQVMERWKADLELFTIVRKGYLLY